MSLDILIGVTEEGNDLRLDVDTSGHMAIQGMTRSGKSVLTYVLVAHAVTMPGVLVAGCDPTGILLGPLQQAEESELRAVGLADPRSHANTVGALVEEMDRRIASLYAPESGLFRDKLAADDFANGVPLILAIFEEYPGLLAALDDDDRLHGRKPDARLGNRVRVGVRRLIQEGAKVGIRVVLIAQRMDAAIIGGAERSNLATRVSMRVDNADALRMLHPGATSELLERVEHFPPGRGYFESPQHPGAVFRADYMTYERYAKHIANPMKDEGKDQ
ncbi:MAG: hypothetical protein MR522_07970 [Trueperella sp.]|uniref:FtsK/SpoIIIE domain-containing protein n=1 Tax=Trueperella sp. TaxID=2699835 RepID=UPI0025FE4B75|nr:FtsK/SpoIIIE domain-containing protein [Trueperella sp.]MCI7306179.1 hypothetical protein [Trueperella sp.]